MTYTGKRLLKKMKGQRPKKKRPKKRPKKKRPKTWNYEEPEMHSKETLLSKGKIN